jgi:hypothetical protein
MVSKNLTSGSSEQFQPIQRSLTRTMAVLLPEAAEDELDLEDEEDHEEEEEDPEEEDEDPEEEDEDPEEEDEDSDDAEAEIKYAITRNSVKGVVGGSPQFKALMFV